MDGQAPLRDSLNSSHHKGQRFDICCSLWTCLFIKAIRGRGEDPGEDTNCARTLFLHLPLTSVSSAPQTTRALPSKDTASICGAEKGRAVSLQEDGDAQVFLAQRQQWGGGGGGRMTRQELNGIPPPEGTVKPESGVEISDSCFYHPRWTEVLFQLLHYRFLAAAGSQYESNTVFFPEHSVLFCLQQQHSKRGSEIKRWHGTCKIFALSATHIGIIHPLSPEALTVDSSHLLLTRGRSQCF